MPDLELLKGLGNPEYVVGPPSGKTVTMKQPRIGDIFHFGFEMDMPDYIRRYLNDRRQKKEEEQNRERSRERIEREQSRERIQRDNAHIPEIDISLSLRRINGGYAFKIDGEGEANPEEFKRLKPLKFFI